MNKIIIIDYNRIDHFFGDHCIDFCLFCLILLDLILALSQNLNLISAMFVQEKQ